MSPPSPTVKGRTVTLTASIRPAAATGVVQFTDKGAKVGGAVRIRDGIASLRLQGLRIGSHRFGACFSGDANYRGSASGITRYRVTAPISSPGVALSAPAALHRLSPASFTVTTHPRSNGSAVLIEHSKVIGSGAVANGSGQIVTTFRREGWHTVFARFTPTGRHRTLSSPSIRVFVGHSSDGGGTPTGVNESIETTVIAGSLTMSIDQNPTVTLTNPILDPQARFLVASGQINPVTVTDTRAATPGFTVSGIVSDFADAHGDLISAADLGWTPRIIDETNGIAVTPGPTVSPSPGMDASAAAFDASEGLNLSRLLASLSPGVNGTAHLGALLSLHAPSDAPPGEYEATLTLTAI